MKCEIKKYRLEKGLSVEKLAKLSGITPGEVSLMERGLRMPRIDTVCKIRDALGVPIDELFTEDEDANV